MAIQVTRVALTTGVAATTQDITISGFGTPTAAIFMCSNASTDDTITADAFLSIGFTDGTRSRCMSMTSEDGVSTANNSRSGTQNVISKPNNAGSASDFDFDFDSFITDGVRISVAKQTSSAYLCTVILISETSGVYAGTHSLSAFAANPITDPGFEPDLIFTLCQGNSTFPNIGTYATLDFGVGINDGSQTSRLIGYAANDGVSPTGLVSYLGNNAVVGQTFGAAQTWSTNVSSYDASGFTLADPGFNANGDQMVYFAIKFSGGLNLDLFDLTIPTAGNYVETGFAGQPDFGLMVFSDGITARNTATSSGVATFGLTVLDDGNAYSVGLSDEDGVSTTNAHSLTNNKLKHLGVTGTAITDSSGYTLDSNGWTFTLTTNPSSDLLGFGLAVSPVPPITVNLGISTETDEASPITDGLITVTLGAGSETDTSNEIEPLIPQDVTVDDTFTTTDSPVIRGTVEIDGSTVDLVVNGTDNYSTKSLSGVYRIPTNPWYEAEKVVFSSGSGVDAYASEPHAWYTKNGNMLCVFRRGAGHVDNGGRLFRAISTDDGATWGSEAVVYDSPTGYDTRNQAGGIDPTTGRIIIFCRVYDVVGASTEDTGYVYSDDNGVTWSAFTSVQSTLSGFPNQMIPFGRIIRTSNGLMQAFGGRTDGCVLFSEDNGLTWTKRATTYSNSPTHLVEPSTVAVDAYRLVTILRDQATFNSFRYVKSEDGGKTWSAVSAAYEYTSTAMTTHNAPFDGIRVENDLLCAFHARAPLFEMYTNRMNIEDFWNAPQNGFAESAVNRVTYATSQGTTALEFGYPWLVVREGHEYTARMFWYDSNTTTGGTDVRTGTFPRL